MNKKFMVTLALCLSAMALLAQSYSIKGIAGDTISKVNLGNSTVSILNAQDSIMQKFTYAANNGSFAINNLPRGKFILLLTYPDYADYAETFTLDAAHTLHDFGRINMILRARLLQEVQIKGKAIAVKIRGDTTEYNPRAYVIQPNAKVEDLLKQLPNMQVDRDGNITAQGKTVTKVLLDGEEFFGDDPKLVTRNIRADMVDKVLLYEKKSDQAAFTGIDDGKRTQTIDIRLKEDRKNGVFGKVIAGAATGKYHEVEGMYNQFRSKEKMSVYATTASDGKIGLGFTDNNKIGTAGSDMTISDQGGVSVNSNDELETTIGLYRGHGLPVTTTAGIHYDNKSADDRESINTNYKVVSLGVTGTQSTQSQLTLPTGIINSDINRNFDNNTFRQKLDVAYQIKFDPTATLKVTADGAIKNVRSKTNTTTIDTDGQGGLLNQTNTTQDGKEQQKIFDAAIFYSKQFKKPGRTFSWLVTEAYQQSNQTGYQYSKTDIYSSAGIKDSIINQYKPANITSSVLNSNMTFSEQLFKPFAVIFNYGFSLNNSIADRESYNQSTSGRYDILDPVYSNDYTYNQLVNQLGVIFNYKTGKTLLNFGTRVSGVNYKQTDQFTENIYRRNFVNWNPQVHYDYQLTSSKRLGINYDGNNTQPSIEQIQPIKINTDPLNIFVGNANLKPSFSNRFFFYYNSYSNSTTRKLYLSGGYSFTSGIITNSTITDPQTGISTIQYINLAGKTPYNYTFSVDVGQDIKALNNINASLELNTNGNINYSYINNALNRSKNNIFSARLFLRKNKQNKFDAYISGGPTYTISEMSLQPQSNNNAAGFASSGSTTIYLPAKFQVSSDISYDYKAKTQTFDAQNITLLKAAISKTFLKGNDLKLSITGNDLLNQNLAVMRRIYGNTTSQTSYNGIKRFFMLTLAWDFTKFKPLPQKN